MAVMGSMISFESRDTHDLRDNEIEHIFRIEQDMWARNEWLWEYVKCNDCERVYSKQDIYGNIEKALYQLTVSEIEQRWASSLLKCHDCRGDVKHMFSVEEYIGEIRDRYSGDALLVLMKDHDKVVGFMDGYFGDYDMIYEREFATHYGWVWKEQIAHLVRAQLDGIIPERMFSCSSTWTTESYMSLPNIYLILQHFFKCFPVSEENVVGISELDAWWSLDKVYSRLGSQSIGVSRHKDLISTTDWYNGEIFVQRKIWKKYKEAFRPSFRNFLKVSK